MALNAAISLIGLAKQTNKATAASQPTFLHGVTGGKILSADIEQKTVEVTSGTREPTAVNRERVATGCDPKFLAHPKSLGLWLLAMCGSVTTTDLGSGRYRHVFSYGSDLPWMTFFGQYGGANYFAMPASKGDKLGISWKGNEPLECSATALSGAIDLTQASLSPTTDDTLAAFLNPVGGTFQLDIDGSTLADAVMMGGSFEVDNALDGFYASGSVLPAAIDPKSMKPGVKLTVVPTDLSIWRNVLTGSPTGTTPSQTAVLGSFLTKFLAGADNLTVKGQKVPFLCNFPDSDPKGGTAEVELEAEPLRPNTTTPSLEFILENTVATY